MSFCVCITFNTYRERPIAHADILTVAVVDVVVSAVAHIRDPPGSISYTIVWPHAIYSPLVHVPFRAAMELCLSNFRKGFSNRCDVAFPCHCVDFAFLSSPFLR